MVWLPEGAPAALVALLMEGVDRNVGVVGNLGSPQVALLMEGVDRNYPAKEGAPAALRRPPHGGRG